MKNKKLLLLLLEDEDNNKEEIQIIPTIDVMMFLLVFFILYTINVIPIFQQSFTLPTSKTSQEQRKEQVLKIYIDKQGEISTEQGLKSQQAVRNYIKENKDIIKAVLIIPDKDAKIEKAVIVLDMLKEEGISDVGIATKKEGKWTKTGLKHFYTQQFSQL